MNYDEVVWGFKDWPNCLSKDWIYWPNDMRTSSKAKEENFDIRGIVFFSKTRTDLDNAWSRFERDIKYVDFVRMKSNVRFSQWVSPFSLDEEKQTIESIELKSKNKPH